MRAFTTMAISIVAVGLLLVSAAEVAAQENSSFTLAFGEPATYVPQGDDGVLLVDVPVEASDPRASGTMQYHTNVGGLFGEIASTLVWRNGIRLTNDDGVWVGHEIGATVLDDGERMQGHVIELDGEGGFDGLSLFAFSQPDDTWLGFIVPADTLPTQPEPPAAED